MACICCGNDVPTISLPSHVGNLQACAACISKHGAKALAAEADRLLTEHYFFEKPEPHCLVCGDPVLLEPTGWRPIWCQKCEDNRKAYVNAQARR
jgi:hypothetical protein